MISKYEKHFYGDDFEVLYLEILKTIKEDPEYVTVGRSNEVCKEICNLTFELTNPRARFVFNAGRNANYEFAMKFWIWMINGCDDAGYLMGVNPNAKDYLDNKQVEENKFATAYGPRIVKQLPYILQELANNDGSRRATISVLQESDLDILQQDTKTEFPCLDSITFFIRSHQLHCQVNMRSNNMATTVVYDVFCFTMLMEYVYKELIQIGIHNIRLGTYYHSCVSAHYFESQKELVDNILLNRQPAFRRIDAK